MFFEELSQNENDAVFTKDNIRIVISHQWEMFKVPVLSQVLYPFLAMMFFFIIYFCIVNEMSDDYVIAKYINGFLVLILSLYFAL